MEEGRKDDRPRRQQGLARRAALASIACVLLQQRAAVKGVSLEQLESTTAL